jgi:mono/diheme cytochrome c family protein
MNAIVPPRWKNAWSAGALLTVLLAALGCRSVRRGEPIVGALATPDTRVQQGQLVFFRNCHSCHPGGEGGLGPALNDKVFPRFLMKTQVRAGFGAMPSFDKHVINADELDDLMKYVLTLRRHDEKLPGR